MDLEMKPDEWKKELDVSPGQLWEVLELLDDHDIVEYNENALREYGELKVSENDVSSSSAPSPSP
jgi:hypothetical protein